METFDLSKSMLPFPVWSRSRWPRKHGLWQRGLGARVRARVFNAAHETDADGVEEGGFCEKRQGN